MGNKIALVIALLIIIGFITMAFVLLGPIPAVIFAGASIGGFVFWRFTTYRTPIDTQKIIIPYLLTVILFIAHVYEEYVTHFEAAMTDITGFHMLQKNFLTVAAFVGPILWITGAILIIKRTQIGFYMLSFFFVAMTIAELSHFVFPFLEDGTFHYVSGMYTAALPLIPAGYGLYITLTEIRKIRNEEKENKESVLGTPIN